MSLRNAKNENISLICNSLADHLSVVDAGWMVYHLIINADEALFRPCRFHKIGIRPIDSIFRGWKCRF